MEEKILYSMESPFQQEINVKGYYFGKNEGKERSACIVGALRGNEYQQLYICSKLIDVLKKIEKHGDMVGENGILVIPSVNNMSMDFGKRFWISVSLTRNMEAPVLPICSDFPMLLKQKADRLTEQHYITTGKEMEQKHFLYTQE